jgi:hypothetical protein
VIRILWIPVIGTIAAVIAVAIAHQPRGDTPTSPPVPRAKPEQFPPRKPDTGRETPPDVPAVPDEGETGPEMPERDQYILRLRADGSFVDNEDGTEYADAAAVLAKLAPPGAPRVTVVVMNDSAAVPETALDAVREQLQTRVDFRKDYRAPEKEPAKDDENDKEDGG